MSTPTLTLVPATTPVAGTSAYAGTSPFRPPVSARDQAAWRAATEPDYFAWLDHVMPAAGCTHPVRLAGQILTVQASTGLLLSTVDTGSMPDGVIYKPCGNRRESVCPSCARTYQADAYQLLRAGLAGGKGVPESVAGHPAVFATLTAPGFGPVHTRHVVRHTCANRKRCDCRAEPCHARRDNPTCQHGMPAVCWARHELGDPRLGQPLCHDCYDYPAHVVFNFHAGELWRRTRIGLERHLRRTATARGIAPRTVRLSYGKVAEMQRRGLVHFHAIIRLDGADPTNPGVILPPPPGLGVGDLVDAIEHAAKATAFTTRPPPTNPAGWPIQWGTHVDVRLINAGTTDQLTDGAVAGYLAKYATKSTEATGHQSRRITTDTIDVYADPDGTHMERVIDTCWTLGRARKWQGLRHWAHMLGYGGHFLTKGRHYSVTFAKLRAARAAYRRGLIHGDTPPAGPDDASPLDQPADDTTLVVNFLRFVGSGWHTAGDAILANTAAAMARERHRVGRDELAHEIGSALIESQTTALGAHR